MKKIICIVLFVMLATPLFAKEIYVATGFGYIKDSNGNIISKAELPIGKHSLSNEYTYVEVGNKQTLDSVQVYAKPTEPTAEDLLKARVTALESKVSKTETDITALKAK